MTIEEAWSELEKFVNLKTTMRPTFVDVLLNAEPVVRCKDCKHYGVLAGMCSNTGVLCPSENDYCSRGEKRC